MLLPTGEVSDDMEWWDARRCASVTGGDTYHGALFHRRAGSLNAARLTHALAAEAKQQGVTIWYNCRASAIATRKTTKTTTQTVRGNN